MSVETPANVAAAAAIPDALPRGELALLGIFNRPGGNAALLRTPQGAILTVAQGETASGYRVTAIDETSVIVINPRGGSHALRMPA